MQITAPTQAKVNADTYIEAKATGAMPAVGTVGFRWDKRAGRTSSRTKVREDVLSVDVNGNAIDWWVDKMPRVPSTIQYRVTARIWQTHNWDEVVFRVDTHEIKVVE